MITILAAFPEGSLPRLRGATFGVDYSADVELLDWGACADFVLPTGEWPAAGSGVGLVWDEPQSTRLVECAWFAVADPSLVPAFFAVTPHPTQGGMFADDSVPSQLDEVEFYGSFGFFQDGSLPCPSPVPGACCQPTGACEMLLPDACDDAGGVYLGVDTVCAPNPCLQPAGACCLPIGTCTELPAAECDLQLGVWLGPFTHCVPNPCPPPLGACCDPATGTCVSATEAECGADGWNYLGAFTNCEPNNCPQIYGACCLKTGVCEVRTLLDCAAASGGFLGADTVCEPGACPLGGACCFPSGICEVRTEIYCGDNGGVFLGEATACEPDACPQPCNGRGVAEGERGREVPRPTGSQWPFGDADRSAAGSNAGGVLILHANPAIVYTDDDADYCGESGLPSCDQAVTSTFLGAPTVVHVLAAFHPFASPRLKAVEFGIDYGACLAILGWGPCAEFELSTVDWPDAGSGAALVWNEVQTGGVTEVYWFAVEPDFNVVEELVLGPYPGHGANFADDSIPSIVDPVAGLGSFGFQQLGQAPCPTEPGACCYYVGTCVIATPETCEATDGFFLGIGTTCDPDPCPDSLIGACCTDCSPTCVVMSQAECDAIPTCHYFLGPGSNCNADPCYPYLGLCCLPDGSCQEMTYRDCDDGGGDYGGDGTRCDASQCGGPVPTEESSWGLIKQRYRN